MSLDKPGVLALPGIGCRLSVMQEGGKFDGQLSILDVCCPPFGYVALCPCYSLGMNCLAQAHVFEHGPKLVVLFGRLQFLLGVWPSWQT